MPAHVHRGAPVAVAQHSSAGVVALLTGLVLVITATMAFGLVVLWSAHHAVPRLPSPYSAPGVSLVSAVVTAVQPQACRNDQETPDGSPAVSGTCGKVVIRLPDGSIHTTTVTPAVYRTGVHVRDRLRVMRFQTPGTGDVSYQFLDFQRTRPLLLLALVCAGLIVLVARWRGLLAMAGVAGTIAALTTPILPALLAGENPLAVAVVGSSAIMIVLLYLVHGVSVRTTSALFGTLIGVGVTALVSLRATLWTHLTGLGTEDDQTLLAVAGQVDLSSVVTASMVVAGLGVLNDVSVTQASAAWELRAARPDRSRVHAFVAAMRIGRDHIASSIYTLVFAYAGSSMTILLLIQIYTRSLGEVAVTDDIATEIARTLVGLIGVVLAVPLTTLIAVLLAPSGAVPAVRPQPAFQEAPKSGLSGNGGSGWFDPRGARP